MQPLLFDINAIVLILGGILAVSALIVAQKPDAQKLIDKLAPYQTMIGVALVILGIIDGIWLLPKVADLIKANLLLMAVQLVVCATSILLGVLLGMSQISKLVAGSPAAERKAIELGQKLTPYQVLMGLVSLAAALLYFLYRFKILTMSA